ncbi:protein-tyrosine phosphatase-like protein, partial [Rhizophagus diaphanus]
YLKICIDDNPFADIYQHIGTCNAFIEKAKDRDGCVFVHCFAGISRSASIVIAYLMHFQKFHTTSPL